MTRPVRVAQRSSRRTNRSGAALISNKVMTLAALLRRSATIVYRRELKLAQSEWRILAMVGDHAPLSLTELAALVGLDKSQLSRDVTNLVKRHILTRKPHARDSREVRIDLSPRGRKSFESLIARAMARNRALMIGLDKTELDTLFSALDRLLENARGQLEHAQAGADTE